MENEERLHKINLIWPKLHFIVDRYLLAMGLGEILTTKPLRHSPWYFLMSTKIALNLIEKTYFRSTEFQTVRFTIAHL